MSAPLLIHVPEFTPLPTDALEQELQNVGAEVVYEIGCKFYHGILSLLALKIRADITSRAVHAFSTQVTRVVASAENAALVSTLLKNSGAQEVSIHSISPANGRVVVDAHWEVGGKSVESEVNRGLKTKTVESEISRALETEEESILLVAIESWSSQVQYGNTSAIPPALNVGYNPYHSTTDDLMTALFCFEHLGMENNTPVVDAYVPERFRNQEPRLRSLNFNIRSDVHSDDSFIYPLPHDGLADLAGRFLWFADCVN